MDLRCRYLGLTLAHPFVAGASPLGASFDAARWLEDGGAAAIVLPSLFEEQITLATRGEIRHRDPREPQFAAALAAFPPPHAYTLTPDGYLEHVRRLKEALGIPVIASLNGTTRGAWMLYAPRIEEAGADALEINFYDVVAEASRSSMSVETEWRNVAVELKEILRIPVAMKLSPYITALGNLAQRLDAAGADGLVLFNRFYQPDINLDTLAMSPDLQLSTAEELRLRLQWIAMLHGRVKASIAASGGVAVVDDGIKAILVGADAVQVVSAVLREGAGVLSTLRDGLAAFGDRRGFATVAAMKGRVSFANVDDPATFQRASYIQMMQSWHSARPDDRSEPQDKRG